MDLAHWQWRMDNEQLDARLLAVSRTMRENDTPIPLGWTITATIREGKSATALYRFRDGAKIVPLKDSAEWAGQIEEFEGNSAA